MSGRSWSISNQRAFLDSLAKKLNINDKEGWYNVTTAVLYRNGGGGLLRGKYNGSLKKMLTTVYSEYPYKIECLVPQLHIVKI